MQLQVQISAKAKQIARIYMNAIVNARRNAPLTQSNNGPIGPADRFNGMASILDAEQGNVDDVNHPFYNSGAATQTKELVEEDPSSPRLGLPGSVFTLEDLDDLIDRITGNKPDFLMMNAREIRTLRTLLRNTGGGTDAYMIQQQGLGNDRPMLMYQDIPIFRNDFISKADPVNAVQVTVSSITDADTLELSADPSTALGGASNVNHLLIRGLDGVLYRYPVLTNTAGTLDLTVSGQFFDPEQNQLVSRVALNSGNFAGVTSAVVAERLDGSSIYAGAWGEMKGVVGFTSSNNAGLKLEYVGPRENENAYQYRLKWYCGFDSYSRVSLARIKNVLPLGA